jgi:hypothetical protein
MDFVFSPLQFLIHLYTCLSGYAYVIIRFSLAAAIVQTCLLVNDMPCPYPPLEHEQTWISCLICF